jgi:hypothetical protein
MSRQVPAVLAKRGIVSVSDNLQPGDQVHIGKAFNRIFRTEIEQRIFRTENKGCDAAGATDVKVPSRSE